MPLSTRVNGGIESSFAIPVVNPDGTYIGSQKDQPIPKPITLIWAEEGAALRDNTFNWSFGNGFSVYPRFGLTQITSGQILGMSLTLRLKRSSAPTTVKVTLNDKETNSVITLPNTNLKGKALFKAPIPFQAGDVLNFKTITAGGGYTGQVCALVQYDYERTLA